MVMMVNDGNGNEILLKHSSCKIDCDVPNRTELGRNGIIDGRSLQPSLPSSGEKPVVVIVSSLVRMVPIRVALSR
jgi:hypothetical protein